MVAREILKHLFAQIRVSEVHINIGGGDALVAEQHLYGPQVGAAFQEMRGKGVSQRVRTDGLLMPARSA